MPPPPPPPPPPRGGGGGAGGPRAPSPASGGGSRPCAWHRPGPQKVSPMNFEFTDEQMLFAESVRKFARAELAPGALKRAHDPRFPFDVAKRMHAQGLMGITLPEADGGVGGTLMDAVIAIEEVASACPRSADVVQFGNFGPIRAFAEYATPAQKER